MVLTRLSAAFLPVLALGCVSDPEETSASQAASSASVDGSTAIPRNPLELRVAGSVEGFAGVQAPAARTPVYGEYPDGIPDWDSGLDSGDAPSIDPCDEDDVAALQGSDWLASLGAGALFVVPPIFDLAYGDGGDGYVYCPVTIVAVTAAGCADVVALSDAVSEDFQTGFGSLIEGMGNRYVTPVGLMIRLIDQGDELWLFSNNSREWWTIDVERGTVTEEPALDAPIAGAVSDGEGGAWLSLSPQLPWPEDSGTPVAAQLVHLDETGTPDGQQLELPFAPVGTGFGRLEDLPPEYAHAHFSTTLTPHFLSNDLARGPDGRYWVLDSVSSTLAAVDVDNADIDTFALPFLYPTGIATEDGTLVVTSGLEADKTIGAVLQEPALHVVSTEDGSTYPTLTLPTPADGWGIDTGFVSLSGSSMSQGVYLDAWLGLSGTGGGALLVTDPKTGRLIVVE